MVPLEKPSLLDVSLKEVDSYEFTRAELDACIERRQEEKNVDPSDTEGTQKALRERWISWEATKGMIDSGCNQRLLRNIAMAKEAYRFLDKSSAWRQNAEKVHTIGTLVCTLTVQFLKLRKGYRNAFMVNAQAVYLSSNL